MNPTLPIFNERDMLDKIARGYWQAKPTNVGMIDYSFRVFARHLRSGSILEMGPAEGFMTRQLLPLATKLTIVEGAAKFCDDLRRNHPTASVVHSTFEEFSPAERFDSIVLGHVLEHVVDPVGVLRRAKSWLNPGGRVLAAVPNSRSLHRQAAVIMGLLRSEDDMSDADRHHGHRRVMNPESFRHLFSQAGLSIEVFGGYWLKPLSNQQIESSWTPEMFQAFMQLGERYPDIAAELYVVARSS